MSAILLAELHRLGIQLQAEGGNLRFRAPPGAVTNQTRDLLRQHKTELLECLADPKRTSQEIWAAVVADVAERWQVLAHQFRARGEEPPWLNEARDIELQVEVAERIRAGELFCALEAIDRWQRAWLDLLAEPTDGTDPRIARGWIEIDSSVLGEHVVVALRPDDIQEAQAARPSLVVYALVEVERLHGTQDADLIRAVHHAKKLLGGVVQDPGLADRVLAEHDGNVRHKNQSVWDMFAEARARFGTRNLEERSITAWLRKHAPEVAARWPEAPLDAGWLDWRQHVGREPLATLDKAFETATGAAITHKEGGAHG